MKSIQTTHTNVLAENLTYLAPGQLKPWPNNPRKHSKEQLKKLENAVREFGSINPIIVDETNIVLAGHARSSVAKAIKLSAVPVIQVNGLSMQQKLAYVIANNRIMVSDRWWRNKAYIELLLCLLSNVEKV